MEAESQTMQFYMMTTHSLDPKHAQLLNIGAVIPQKLKYDGEKKTIIIPPSPICVQRYFSKPSETERTETDR